MNQSFSIDLVEVLQTEENSNMANEKTNQAATSHVLAICNAQTC